ncbi:MAG: hypothetical protein ACOC8D_01345, partial [bacterium]
MSRRWLADPRTHLAAIAVAFAALAAAVQVHCADLLSSDGEAYLRIAGWYAAGDFRRAVFGHWSPLGSWLSVPLVAAGMVPRYAMRLWIGLWGGLGVFGVWRLGGRFGLGPWLRAAATACAALMVAEFSAYHRVDLLLAALLLLYLDAALDERLLTSRWRPVAAGLLGGLAYLAKLYALPFFVVHFALMVLLRGWASAGQARGRLRGMDRAWALGVAAFAVVAAPWVGVLSAKYGRLTFGTAAATSYALVGPGSGDARQRAIQGLRRPPEDAPNVWQDATPPPARKTESGGGGDAGEWLALQAAVAWRNAGRIAGHLASADECRLALASVPLAVVAALLTRRRRPEAFRYLALVVTVGVFCGGYALVQAANPRYFWFVFLVLTVAAFHFVGRVPGVLARLWPRSGARTSRLLAVAVGALAVVSFAFHPIRALGALLRQPPPGREHRLVARRLAEWEVEGPLASLGERGWWDGLH